MNQFKPLLILAVLGGVLYWVYSHINSGPVTLPPGVADSWDKGPKVESPSEAAPGPPWKSSGGNPSWNAGAPAAPGGVAPAAPPNVVGADVRPAPLAPNAAAPLSIAAPPPGVDPAAPTATAPGFANSIPESLRQPAAPSAAASGFAAVMEAARKDLDEGKLVEAHLQLSRWFDEPQLTPAQRQELVKLLDQVAGTVIYSTQHTLEQPYEIRPGDRLEDIAKQYDVPPQLLAKINGIDDANNLVPGDKLKVVRGPFSAVVNLGRHELTLMVGGMYAGRFSIGVGTDYPPREGSFTVASKVVDPVYYGVDRTVEARDRTNPLGTHLIGLDDRVSIHGTNDDANIGRDNLRGSISLSRRDVGDVFDILTEGSKITIRR